MKVKTTRHLSQILQVKVINQHAREAAICWRKYTPRQGELAYPLNWSRIWHNQLCLRRSSSTSRITLDIYQTQLICSQANDNVMRPFGVREIPVANFKMIFGQICWPLLSHMLYLFINKGSLCHGHLIGLVFSSEKAAIMLQCLSIANLLVNIACLVVRRHPR